MILTNKYKGQNVTRLSKLITDKIGDETNNELDPLKAKIIKIINRCLFDLALNRLTRLFNNFISNHFNFVL